MSTLSSALATHLRQVFFGGNWTSVCVQDVLSDVTVEQASASATGHNSILRLTYHIAYYVRAQISVFENNGLHSNDAESFSHPAIVNESEWRIFLQQIFTDVERLARLIEVLNEEVVWGNFENEQYGSVFRNVAGMIEHTHYHLGQIVLIKRYFTTTV